MLSITSGQDPCSVLNPALIGTKTALTYTTGSNGIVSTTPGTLKKFIEIPNSLNTSNVLNTSSTAIGSSLSLIKYLSGGTDNTGAKTFGNIGLRKKDISGNDTGALLGIVDTYITVPTGIRSIGYTYTFSSGTGSNAPLTNNEIQTIRDKLLTDKHLLNETELYTENQLKPGASVTSGTESLLYLIKLDKDTPLKDDKLTRKKELETRNLRFFSAFLVEYCFYRVRYTKMLEDYFTTFTQAPASYTTPVTASDTTDTVANLFGTTTEPPKPTSIQQADHLKILTYHMACLKTRMTDMIRLLNSINEYYNGIFTNIQNAINVGELPGSSASLQGSIQVLNQSTEESKKYMTEAQFRQGAMEYTQEKNRNANILLGLYAFLNLTALAIIFRVSSS